MTRKERDRLRAEWEADACRHHMRDAETIARVFVELNTLEAGATSNQRPGETPTFEDGVLAAVAGIRRAMGGEA